MKRTINAIKSKLILIVFLLWHDKKSKPITKYIALTTLSLIGALWGFSLDNLSRTGVMSPEAQRTIRGVGTYVLLGISVSLLAFHTLRRYKKYKNTHNLTNEELNNFLEHMNEAS